MKKQKKNPLYVVSKKGRVVEEAESTIDAFIKQFNLVPLVKILDSIIKDLLTQIKSYAMLVAVADFFEKLYTMVLSFLGIPKTQKAASH